MERALEEARKALERGEVPIGCALYTDSGELVAVGSNRTNELGNATAHAEFMALRQLSSCREGGLRLYVTCEPCVMCAGAIVQSGVVAHIEYGCANPRFGGCGTVRPLQVHVRGPSADPGAGAGANGNGAVRTAETLPSVKGGVRADECVRLLSRFYTTINPNAPKPKRRRASPE